MQSVGYIGDFPLAILGLQQRVPRIMVLTETFISVPIFNYPPYAFDLHQTTQGREGQLLLPIIL
jgi:hypothetical protein